MSQSELLTRSVASVIPRTLAESKLKSGKPLRVYWGIDPTGSRIHVGHTVPMRKLQAFADAGHEAILLIGSFTAMIGDPSDRDAERKSLTREQVEENFKTYKVQVAKVIDFTNVRVVYNHEWLEKLTSEEVLRLASNFTVQQMSERKMFADRISKGKPVGVHEFMYPLLVGYDSVHLDVDGEIGGTDQEFNMLAGRTLQTAFGKREKFVLTTPLIEGTDGRKMSKSYNNCIFIDDSPRDMYGKTMSIRDELLETYFACCTGVPVMEVAQILKGKPRDAKARLAQELVTLYHGSEAAVRAGAEFEKIFREKGIPEDVPVMKVMGGTALVDALVRGGVAPSKSEARRLIKQGGVKRGDTTVDSMDAEAEEGIYRIGKRKFVRIVMH